MMCVGGPVVVQSRLSDFSWIGWAGEYGETFELDMLGFAMGEAPRKIRGTCLHWLHWRLYATGGGPGSKSWLCCLVRRWWVGGGFGGGSTK